MFSKVTGIETIHLTNEDDKNPPYKPIINENNLRNVIGLTFDYKSERIFFSDIQRWDLQTAHFDGSNMATVVEGMNICQIFYLNHRMLQILHLLLYFIGPHSSI